MRKSYCKICEFFNHVKWEKANFEKKVREGSSLRILEAYLEGLGCKCSLKTISKHISKCMGVEVKEQRKIERSLLKAKKPFQKLREFFIKPELPKTSECEHKRTTHFFSLVEEKVKIKCLECGLILGDYEPERNERNTNPRELLVLESLSRKRRKRK